MALCLELALEQLRRVLGSPTAGQPGLFLFENCSMDSDIAFHILQLAGMISISAHLGPTLPLRKWWQLHSSS